MNTLRKLRPVQVDPMMGNIPQSMNDPMAEPRLGSIGFVPGAGFVPSMGFGGRAAGPSLRYLMAGAGAAGAGSMLPSGMGNANIDQDSIDQYRREINRSQVLQMLMKPDSQDSTYPVYKKTSTEAGSFRDSFAAARKAGQHDFVWNGRRYSTELR